MSFSNKYARFKQQYSERHVMSGGLIWPYYVVGDSGPALLLLPGGMGRGDSYFFFMQELERDYRLISPSYPEAATVQEMMEGLLAIVEKENLQCVHILGVSFGGLLAQEWIHRHPHKVGKVILSNTSTVSTHTSGKITHERAKKVQRLITLLRWAPEYLLKHASRRKITPHLRAMSPEDKQFWQNYFSSALEGKSVGQMATMYECMLDFIMNYAYSTPDDKEWEGRILIIESPTDRAINKAEQEAVRELYPFAQTTSFAESGHLSIITRFDEYVQHVRRFLESDLKQ